MAYGYFTDPKTHRMDWVDHPEAVPDIQTAMRKRDAKLGSFDDTQDLSGEGNKIESTQGSLGDAGKGAAKSMAAGGSAEDAIGSGLMASGNPYAMGAGAALMTANQINKNRYAQEVAKYNALQDGLESARQDAKNFKV